MIGRKLRSKTRNIPAQSGYRDPTGASKWQYDSDIKDSQSLSLRAREELGSLATSGWRHEPRRGASRLSISISIHVINPPFSKTGQQHASGGGDDGDGTLD